jgi:peptidoglycan/xylan/chitin deacetylase (PgdA/CDA1 family)
VTGALMYHELERRGRPLADTTSGYVRYVVGESRFAEQMAWLAAAGLRGVAIGRALERGFAAPQQVAITFDDGCESDLVVAAPLLARNGFGATFYIVSRWVGRRHGFLSRVQLRELADAGFEVGSHSATHAFLTELDAPTLRRELHDSRRELEDIVARPVAHLSCPGGRVNRRVAEAAREAGYVTMATSRIGVNRPSTDRFALRRCAIHRDTPQHTFEAFCRGTGLGALQAQDRALSAAKALCGNRLYALIRRAMLSRRAAVSLQH